jgi:hypothetical protein
VKAAPHGSRTWTSARSARFWGALVVSSLQHICFSHVRAAAERQFASLRPIFGCHANPGSLHPDLMTEFRPAVPGIPAHPILTLAPSNSASNRRKTGAIVSLTQEGHADAGKPKAAVPGSVSLRSWPWGLAPNREVYALPVVFRAPLWQTFSQRILTLHHK